MTRHPRSRHPALAGRLGPVQAAATLAWLAFTAPASAEPPGTLRLVAGEPSGRHAVIAVGREAVTIETRRAGVVGSVLAVAVDRQRRPIFTQILTDRDCGFDNEGSRCLITLPARGGAARKILSAFRRAREGRIAVTNAGSMQMDETVSLASFHRSRRGT